MMVQDSYIHKLAAKGARIDGRKFGEFRNVSIDDKTIEKAEGSAIVRLGDTKVIAGVKLDVGTPFPDKPDEGVLMVSAEFSPISSPDFEAGPPSDESIELARIVDRGIRESCAVDMKKLCIKAKEKVWIVNIDINILDNFGNLIDASAIASAAALSRTVFPKFDGEVVDSKEKTKKKLPVTTIPVACTFVKIGDSMVCDPVLEEEDASSCRLTLTTKDDGNVCAIQKGGEGALTSEEIEKALDMAVSIGKELRKQIAP